MDFMKMLLQRCTGNSQNIGKLFQCHMPSKIFEQIFLCAAAEGLRFHTNMRLQTSSPPFARCSSR